MENIIRKKAYATDPEIRWVRMFNDKWFLELPQFWEDKTCEEAKLYEITIREVKDEG